MKKILYLALSLPFLFAFSMPPKTNVYYVLKDKAVFHNGIYWSKSEVSNIEYKDFLMGLIEEGKADLVPKYAPDMKVWLSDTSFVNPYAEYYFSHPAFNQYPVVGISHEAATEYCAWMTRKCHARVGHTAKRPTEQNFTFRLPTEEEWRSVARGEAKNDAWIAGGYHYPRDHKGRFLFNHRLGEGDYAGIVNGNPKDYEGYMITAPVVSFPETSNGLYNISGNVAEMLAEAGMAKGGSWRHLAEECQIESVQEYDGPQDWLGFRFVLAVGD